MGKNRIGSVKIGSKLGANWAFQGGFLCEDRALRQFWAKSPQIWVDKNIGLSRLNAIFPPKIRIDLAQSEYAEANWMGPTQSESLDQNWMDPAQSIFSKKHRIGPWTSEFQTKMG